MQKVLCAVLTVLALFTVAGCSAIPLPAGAPLLVSSEHRPPRGLVDFCRNNSRLCATDAAQVAVQRIAEGHHKAPVELTFSRLMELRQVNVTVNRRITPRSDLEVFGRADHWTDNTEIGDCDDYVMTKRKELIARGWPASSLLILLADTETGERHVVLLAVTDRGDLVLDNRFDVVLPWDRVGYRWIARQSPDHLLRWHRVARADAKTGRETVLARRFP